MRLHRIAAFLMISASKEDVIDEIKSIDTGDLEKDLNKISDRVEYLHTSINDKDEKKYLQELDAISVPVLAVNRDHSKYLNDKKKADYFIKHSNEIISRVDSLKVPDTMKEVHDKFKSIVYKVVDNVVEKLKGASGHGEAKSKETEPYYEEVSLTEDDEHVDYKGGVANKIKFIKLVDVKSASDMTDEIGRVIGVIQKTNRNKSISRVCSKFEFILTKIKLAINFMNDNDMKDKKNKDECMSRLKEAVALLKQLSYPDVESHDYNENVHDDIFDEIKNVITFLASKSK